MHALLAQSLDGLDRCWSRAFAPVGPAPHLLVVAFHAIATNAKAQEVLAPRQAVSLEDVRRFLDAVLTAGYAPASVAELERAGTGDGNRFAVTFDDGYFNNAAVLAVLEQFEVPASFFISTNHVSLGNAFWWDVVARAARRAGKCERQVIAGLEQWKLSSAREIGLELVRALGPAALRPVSDQDRPFSESELRDFARSRWVTLGNHTADHTILTRCSGNDAEAAIAQGQRFLQRITGTTPRAIAYPDGAFSPQVVAAARRRGHFLGFTCVPKSNALPLPAGDEMVIGRHIITAGRNYAKDIRRISMPTVLPSARIRAVARKVL